MFSVHQQTIRLYEKQGLITPKRSSGGTRLFSEEDIDRLEDVIYLTHELGINLAGVEMVLKLKKQIKKMQNDMNRLFEQTQEQLDVDAQTSKQAVQQSAQQLLKIRKERAEITGKAIPELLESSDDTELQTIDVDNWEIEYDEEG